MAGGYGTNPSVPPAAATPATPAAASTNYGMPKFEAVTATDLNAAPTTTTAPAVMPNMGFGMPSWLSAWTGASFGAPGQSKPATSGYAPYVPGMGGGGSGVGQYRPPVVYQPPSKPVDGKDGASGIPAVPGMDFSMWNNPAIANIREAGGTGMTPAQKQMMQWMQWYNGTPVAGNPNGVGA